MAHPVAVLLAVSAIALALGAGVFRLRRDPSPDAFIPKNHPVLASKRSADERFGLTEPIAIGVIRDGPGGVFNAHTLALIRDLTDAIRRLPAIESGEVISLATESGVYFKDREPAFDRLLKQVPADAPGLEALKQDVLSYELYRGTLVAADGSAACIVVRLRDEHRADAIYRELRDLLADFPVRDERLVIAGEAAVRAHMGQAVSDDALRMNFISPAVMFLLIVLAYRTGRGTVLPLAVIGAASAAALGAMGWCGVPVYIVTNGIFVVIMALSVSDSFHVLGQYYEEQLRPDGRTRQQLVVDTCVALWFPMLVTSVTDFTGFLALYLAGGMPPIEYFGLFTCVGVLAAFVFSCTLLPSGLALLPLRMSAVFARRQEPGRLDVLARGLGKLGRFTFRHPRVVLCGGVLLTAISLWGAAQLRVNDARIFAFKQRHAIVQATRILNERFDGTSHLNIVVAAATKGALLQPEALRRIEALEAFTETLPHVGGTHSVAGWVKRAHQRLHDDQPAYYAIPSDPSDTKFYLDALTAKTCPMSRLLREVVDPTYTAANLIVRMRSSEFIHQREVIQALEGYLAEHFRDPSLRVELAGRVNLDYHWMRMIRTSHVRGVAFSAACALLFTGLMFRSLVGGLLCLAVVGLVVLINYAVMGFAGIPLGISTSMFASIAIGVGINAPIHLMDRLRHALRVPGAEPERVFAETLAFTGRALFFAAFVLAVGFLLLCVSQFRTLIEFGLLIGLALVVSFVISVTLLPAFIATVKPRVIWGETKEPGTRIGHE